jgi:hypothetical protein
MPRLHLHLVAPAALAAALLVHSASKPCTPSSQGAADSLLTKGNVAMWIPGTRRVTVDQSGTCLQIEVGTPGTARLVGLLLRTLHVPHDAVRFQVVS